MNSSDKQRRRTGPKPQRSRAVRLQSWLDAQGFGSVDLESASGVCRQTMTYAKAGRDVRLSTIIRITRGARVLAQRHVSAEELFDFGYDEDASTKMPNTRVVDTNDTRA